MKVKVKNTMPRLFVANLGGKKIQFLPNDIYEVEESELLGLFSRHEKVMGHYLEEGLIRFHANESPWTPDGKTSPSLFDIAEAQPVPVGVAVEEKKERAEKVEPTPLGGGVPGQGVKDCKANVRDCEDVDTLLGWLEAEKRSTVIAEIEKRLGELE